MALAELDGERGDETERELELVIEEADLEGPSFDATSADLSRNFLYSYFAVAEDENTAKKRHTYGMTHIGCIARFRCLVLNLLGLAEEGA